MVNIRNILWCSTVFCYIAVRTHGALKKQTAYGSLAARTPSLTLITFAIPDAHYIRYSVAMLLTHCKAMLFTVRRLPRYIGVRTHGAPKKQTAYGSLAARTPSLTLASSLFRRIASNAPYGSYRTSASENLTENKGKTPRGKSAGCFPGAP